MLDPISAMRHKLALVLDDLHQAGSDDPDAMWFTGKFASEIAARLGAPAWSATRGPIRADTFDDVLRACDSAFSEHRRSGRERHAYAVQLIGTAWAARAHDDAQIAEGARLLDEAIDRAVDFYKANPLPDDPPAERQGEPFGR